APWRQHFGRARHRSGQEAVAGKHPQRGGGRGDARYPPRTGSGRHHESGKAVRQRAAELKRPRRSRFRHSGLRRIQVCEAGATRVTFARSTPFFPGALPMIRFRLPLAAFLLMASTVAMASSASTTSDAISGAIGGTSNGISASSGSFSDNRIVLAARDDAASFVASDGAIRGVQLVAALVLLRAELPEIRTASDLALAQAILAL